MPSSRSTHRDRFEAVYEQHYSAVWAYARRRLDSAADADDVSAQCWLTVWRRIESLPATDALPWCYGVARRCVANHRRSAVRQLRLAAAVAKAPAHDGAAIDVTCAPDRHDAAAQRLRNALGRLSVDDQEILRLAAWERLAHAEIALVIETTTANVAVRLHRAKRRLASAMQDLESAGHIGATTPIAEPKGSQ